MREAGGVGNGPGSCAEATQTNVPASNNAPHNRNSWAGESVSTVGKIRPSSLPSQRWSSNHIESTPKSGVAREFVGASQGIVESWRGHVAVLARPCGKGVPGRDHALECLCHSQKRKELVCHQRREAR